jgi:hypothetical protein
MLRINLTTSFILSEYVDLGIDSIGSKMSCACWRGELLEVQGESETSQPPPLSSDQLVTFQWRQ